MPTTKNDIRSADIYNENFNVYFVEKLNNMSPVQRNKLPLGLAFKIFQQGTKASSARLNFNERMWILAVVFGHKITLSIDDDGGIDGKDLKAARKAQKGQMLNGELLEQMKLKSAFVLSDRDLMRSLMYMNHVCSTPIYTLIRNEIVANTSNIVDQRFKASRDKLQSVLKLLQNYEANKRRMFLDFKLSTCEWLALLYFSTGERPASPFYDGDMLYSYNSSRANLHGAMKRLEVEGFLDRRGMNGSFKCSLSSKGINLLNDILDKIVMKF
jgi:hypothetical protein